MRQSNQNPNKNAFDALKSIKCIRDMVTNFFSMIISKEHSGTTKNEAAIFLSDLFQAFNEESLDLTKAFRLLPQEDTTKILEILFEALKSNQKIHTVILDNNSIRSKQIELIIKSIGENKSIRKLSLEYNELDYRAAKIISEVMIKKSPNFNVFLADNRLCFDGVPYILDAMKRNTPSEISLSAIDDASIDLVAKYVANAAHQIMSLKLTCAETSSRSMNNLLEAIELTKISTVFLDMPAPSSDRNFLRMFVSGLAKNRALKSLTLRIRDRDIRTVKQLLQECFQDHKTILSLELLGMDSQPGYGKIVYELGGSIELLLESNRSLSVQTPPSISKIFGTGDVINKIFSFLDLPSAGRAATARTYADKARFFQNPNSKLQRAVEITAFNSLCACVVISDWDVVEKIAEKKPHLIFIKNLFTLVDASVVSMSPVQYALYIGDYHMLVMFQKIIKNDPKLINLYKQHELEQSTRLDCEKFVCDVYEIHFKHVEQWFYEKDGITDEVMDNFWCKNVRSVQMLVAWATRERCAKDKDGKFDWSLDSNFDKDRPTGVCSIFNFWTKNTFDFFGMHNFAFAISTKQYGEWDGWPMASRGLATDGDRQGAKYWYAEVSDQIKIYRHLFKTRKKMVDSISILNSPLLALTDTMPVQNTRPEQNLDEGMQHRNPGLF